MKSKYKDISYMLFMYIPAIVLVLYKHTDWDIDYINIALYILTIGVGVVSSDMIQKYSKKKNKKKKTESK